MNDASGITKVQKLFDDLAKSGFQPIPKKLLNEKTFISSCYRNFFCL